MTKSACAGSLGFSPRAFLKTMGTRCVRGLMPERTCDILELVDNGLSQRLSEAPGARGLTGSLMASSMTWLPSTTLRARGCAGRGCAQMQSKAEALSP